MRKSILLILTLLCFSQCSNESKTAELSKTDALIAQSDSVASQASQSGDKLDSVTTVTVDKANTNVGKLLQLVEVYKTETKKLKSVQQIEKVITIHDTIFITEKKGFFGKTKKTTVSKSATDSVTNETNNEQIDSTITE